MRNKILLVEDTADLSLIISETLLECGYDVVAAYDGKDGLAKFIMEKPDIVVADVMMPKLDGFDMARKIRSISPNVPLLFLTAKSGIDDVEKGFEIGANDYLKKPFELRELVVRIKALLRKGSNIDAVDAIYVIGKYIFNPGKQILIFDGLEIELSNIEVRLLEPIAANIGKTVSATDLMIAVWGRDEISNRNSLHGFIHKLRRVLRHDPSVAIINQRGFGYMLVVR
ncbi:response regulator transcription factor [uncultured Muribaculum sp.]|uniref:response regulator transcription factor n=1 Tax=uncultured Muribaculum sp. TaxID=1918613 RepID=UPI00267497EE|nr:response regulator transcription factor [uncultured Muribaculum sp.]